jgi:hypothetical protein
LETGDPAGDFRKKISGLEFEKIFVDVCHGRAGIEKGRPDDKGEIPKCPLLSFRFLRAAPQGHADKKAAIPKDCGLIMKG